jgi:hypothetical protein
MTGEIDNWDKPGRMEPVPLVMNGVVGVWVVRVLLE